MSLLTELVDTALEPGYRTANAEGPAPRARGLLLITLLLAGALIGVAVFQNLQQQPQAAQERELLITQLRSQQDENDQLRQLLGAVGGDVDDLQAQAVGKDSSSGTQLSNLGAISGATAVSGPGIVIVVDDSTTMDDDQSRVIDQDLRQLVNGLWASGAEAIAINGHRLSSRTAIRGAGAAITVDYTSLTRPYTVEAIGNPETLPARWASTAGATWWDYLKDNHGMRYELSVKQELLLAADPGLDLQKAGPTK